MSHRLALAAATFLLFVLLPVSAPAAPEFALSVEAHWRDLHNVLDKKELRPKNSDDNDGLKVARIRSVNPTNLPPRTKLDAVLYMLDPAKSASKERIAKSVIRLSDDGKLDFVYSVSANGRKRLRRGFFYRLVFAVSDGQDYPDVDKSLGAKGKKVSAELFFVLGALKNGAEDFKHDAGLIEGVLDGWDADCDSLKNWARGIADLGESDKAKSVAKTEGAFNARLEKGWQEAVLNKFKTGYFDDTVSAFKAFSESVSKLFFIQGGGVDYLQETNIDFNESYLKYLKFRATYLKDYLRGTFLLAACARSGFAPPGEVTAPYRKAVIANGVDAAESLAGVCADFGAEVFTEERCERLRKMCTAYNAEFERLEEKTKVAVAIRDVFDSIRLGKLAEFLAEFAGALKAELPAAKKAAQADSFSAATVLVGEDAAKKWLEHEGRFDAELQLLKALSYSRR